MDFDREHDRQTRFAAFKWLGSQVSAGGVVSRATIARGFQYGGRRVQLVGHQGIVTPDPMDLPLSIRASQRGHSRTGSGPIWSCDIAIEVVILTTATT